MKLSRDGKLQEIVDLIDKLIKPETAPEVEQEEVQLEEFVLEDGRTIRYEVLEAGQPILVVGAEGEEDLPLEDGEYVINEMEVMVAEGVIAEVKEMVAPVEDAPEEEMNQEEAPVEEANLESEVVEDAEAIALAEEAIKEGIKATLKAELDAEYELKLEAEKNKFKELLTELKADIKSAIIPAPIEEPINNKPKTAKEIIAAKFN